MTGFDISRFSRPIGYLFALLTVAIWSGNFVVARGLTGAIPPVEIAFWRWTTAFVVLLALFWRVALRDWRKFRQHPRYILAVAFTGVTLFNTLIYVAGHWTAAANMSVIAGMNPIIVLFWIAFRYGVHITLKQWIGVAVAFTGACALATGGGLAVPNVGDAIMVAAAVSFAAYNILLGRNPTGMDGRAFLLFQVACGWLMLLPAYLIEKALSHPVHWEVHSIGSILYIGLGASVTAYLLWNAAIRRIGVGSVAVIYYLIPVFASLAAWLILGEGLGLASIASIGAVIAGVALASIRKN